MTRPTITRESARRHTSNEPPTVLDDKNFNACFNVGLVVAVVGFFFFAIPLLFYSMAFWFGG